MHTLFAVLVAALLVPSSAWPQMNAAYSSLQEERRALEMQQNQANTQSPDLARRRAAALEAHQFEVGLADFARVWNDFVKEYSDRGTYNLKKAKSLSRALKKLQTHLPE